METCLQKVEHVPDEQKLRRYLRKGFKPLMSQLLFKKTSVGGDMARETDNFFHEQLLFYPSLMSITLSAFET